MLDWRQGGGAAQGPDTCSAFEGESSITVGGVVSVGSGIASECRVGSSGNSSTPSGYPSPSESASSGLVPNRASAASERPSPSESMANNGLPLVGSNGSV